MFDVWAQATCWTPSPSQRVPLNCASTLPRDRSFMPAPHVTEQMSQSLHSCHSQFTGQGGRPKQIEVIPALPSHGFPPHAAGTATVRILVMFPAPHVVAQADQ